MTRIMFFGDAARTGFGTVTADLGRALLDMGHDLRFVSQNDLGEGDLPEPFTGRTAQITRDMVLPERAEALGMSSLALAEQAIIGLLDGQSWDDRWTPEAAILLGDYYGVEHFVWSTRNQAEAFRRLPTFHYVPIEGVDLPPTWRKLWDVVQPVAMSEFGAEQIRRVTGERPRVAYHGVDAQVFRPVGDHRWEFNGRRLRTKLDCRRALGADGLEDTRWVIRTDRLMPRKRYASLLRAMAPVMAQRPNVFLLIHAQLEDEGGHLPALTSKLPEPIQNRIIFTRAGGQMDREALAVLYNAADVYASPSAEGFGLTIAEAMACGVPAVGMDYSSVTEVIGPGGLLAPVNVLIDNEYDHAWAAVDERAFGEQVAKLLDDEVLRKQLGRAARRHVTETFTWQACAGVFSELIEAATRPTELRLVEAVA